MTDLGQLVATLAEKTSRHGTRYYAGDDLLTGERLLLVPDQQSGGGLWTLHRKAKPPDPAPTAYQPNLTKMEQTGKISFKRPKARPGSAKAILEPGELDDPLPPEWLEPEGDKT